MTAILVTRPGGDADPMVRALEGRGYRVHAVPTVVTEPLAFDVAGLDAFDWIVVTSAAGVGALRALPAGPKWAAVGKATAQALRARGVKVAVVPPASNGAALAGLIPDVAGKRVLLVRASAAARDLPDQLRRRGATVEEVTAYTTSEGPESSAAPLQAALSDADLEAVVFASGSAIRGFLALGGTARWPAITIGPRTTATAREHGFHVVAEAEAQSADALALAVVRAVPLKEKNRA
ncbi:uroporphyrinogen-III synthase [bacterium]|nr:MAG: uroporphyrinogen-III synthase [bacterium]